MKFSHSLQFNAVPEWSSKYINYSGLKKIIYTEQRNYAETLSSAHEHELPAFVINDDPENPINVFEKALDKELVKVDAFYKLKEKELYAQYTAIIEEFDDFEREFPATESDDADKGELRALIGSLNVDAYRDDLISTKRNGSSSSRTASPPSSVSPPKNCDTAKALADATPLAQSVLSRDAFCNSSANVRDEELAHATTAAENLRLSRRRSLPTLFDDEDFKLTFLEALKMEKRKPLSAVFVRLSELKSYVELNRVGFGKALKKFDKVMYTSIKGPYLANIDKRSYIFKPTTLARLNMHIEDVVRLYSIFTMGDLELAKDELRSNLREYVVWERNTVWRDMIGMERKSQAAYADKTKLGEDEFLASNEKFDIPLGAGRKLSIPRRLVSGNAIRLVLIVIIAVTLLFWSPFDDEQQRNCFAVLVCASLLWATEAIPLFTTSILVPFLIVVFRVLKDPETGEVLYPVEASKYICAAMWSPIILLLLGGFSLAAALSKYNLDKIACTFLLSRVPQHPVYVLGAIMAVSTLVSAFVSNVAAPVLMYSVVRPVLSTLPEGSSFAQALVIGVALASDISGIVSPIASPQNVIALQSMDPAPNWLQWFTVSIPVCCTTILLVYVFLLFNFDFKGTTLVPIKGTDDRISWQKIYVIVVSLATVALWCMASLLEGVVGDMGMIAIASMVAFYAPGILSPDDFNNYPWTIVMLAMGGLALGKGVTVSGLLETIAKLIKEGLQDKELFTVLSIFGVIVTVTATFVSHTVAALIIIPLIAEIGKSLPDPHPNLLVMATAFLCSSGMALPTSGFPNVTAIGQRDSVGKPYLTVSMFLKSGGVASVFMYLVVIFLGYLLMKMLNF
ncbi:DEKNAAC103721 [Brettanomyces naardenensis]|uniref:DEKNAAC103721 n=1 Tax=Brettanomyces naardenensis TaxID=13370 RepID=A0A448YN14_BRENA|nr:DEKNAAC103721 [Brettanomyces naardenensis]